jgi:Mn2+/Fe2+ NRAMP family transporter
MKKVFAIMLGIVTAFGGFVDIGDLVANSETGARFRMSLAWAVVVGVIGIVLYAEMSGRVAAIAKRPVFDLVRERLGARMALVNLVSSFFLNFLTLIAEIAGMAVVVQLLTGVNYLAWIVPAAVFTWFVIWKMKFSAIEKVFGLAGCALLVMAVALWHMHPSWGGLLHQTTHPSLPKGEGLPTYFYFAIALLGAAMTPYEVFFFSSGAVEEGWTPKDLNVNRANVLIGFPLGGALTLVLMALASLVYAPHMIHVDSLSQSALPVALSLGRVGLAIMLVGMFAAIGAASLETALSSGYTIAQYFGWQWGTFVKPRQAPRFHLVVILSLIFGALAGLTTIDPIKVTELSLVLSAAALPLTYFPILVIANDRAYMGRRVNSRPANVLATAYFVLLVVAAGAAIPLMIVTKMGS